MEDGRFYEQALFLVRLFLKNIQTKLESSMEESKKFAAIYLTRSDFFMDNLRGSDYFSEDEPWSTAFSELGAETKDVKKFYRTITNFKGAFTNKQLDEQFAHFFSAKIEDVLRSGDASWKVKSMSEGIHLFLCLVYIIFQTTSSFDGEETSTKFVEDKGLGELVSTLRNFIPTKSPAPESPALVDGGDGVSPHPFSTAPLAIAAEDPITRAIREMLNQHSQQQSRDSASMLEGVEKFVREADRRLIDGLAGAKRLIHDAEIRAIETERRMASALALLSNDEKGFTNKFGKSSRYENAKNGK